MNVTEVVFSGFYKTQICGLYQYDYGQVLKFTDITLPSTYEVHFAQSGASTTVTVLGDENGVQIPDQYLLADLDIRAYIYLHEEETDGETVYQVLIPVIARPEPTDVEPTPVEQDIITQTIAALNSAVDTAEDYAADASQSASDSAASAISAQAWAEAAQESAESIDTSTYATKAALQSEESARSLADTSLGNDINAETQRATQAEASIRLAIPSKTSQLQNDSGFLTSAPVSSVNGKTGAVSLSASDVGALPASTAIPSKTSDLTNDSHFITASEAPVQSVNGQTGAVTLPTATTSADGLMSSTDKSRLDTFDLALAKLDASLITDIATGNPSVFPDGANLPVKSLTAEIEPVQDLNGYDYPWVGGAGKNLIGYLNSRTSNGITFTYDPITGGVHISGTARAVAWQDAGISESVVEPYSSFKAGTYIASGGATDAYFRVQAWYEDGQNEILINNSNTSATFTLEQDAKIFMRYYIQKDVTIDETVYPMIRDASIADDTFEPYSNICPITGYDEVNVTRTGKNLLKQNTVTRTLNGVVGTKKDDGTWIFNGTCTANSDFDIFSGSNIALKSGESYTLSGCPGGGGGTTYKLRVRIASDSGNEYPQDLGSGATITAKSNARVNRAYVELKNGYTYNNVVFKPQLELGTTATPYEPYQSQTVEVTLNDTVYGGILNVTTGELVVDRAMVTLDGNTQWTQYAVGKYYSSAVAPNMAGGSAVANMFISNLYKFEGEGGSASSAITTDKRFYGQRGYSRFWIYDSSFDTVEALKSMLADTPMTVVYPLDTPQTIQLTASQLSTLLGTNVISADSGAVEVEYYADTKLYINKVVANAQS